MSAQVYQKNKPISPKKQRISNGSIISVTSEVEAVVKNKEVLRIWAKKNRPLKLVIGKMG